MPNPPELIKRRNRRFRELWAQGMSTEEIREEMGYTQHHTVVRIARELGLLPPSTRLTKEQEVERWARVADLAANGRTSAQIAAMFKIDEGWLKVKGKRLGITFPANELTRRRETPSNDRLMEATVLAIDAAATGLDMVNIASLNPEKLPGWLAAMDEAMTELNRFHRKIKEAASE